MGLPENNQSIGTYVSDNLRQAIEAGAHVAEEVQKFNREISAARLRFFSGCSAGVRDAEAEAEFAKLLFGKDLYYLSLFAYEGVTPAAEARVKGMGTLTGGSLDGGITSLGFFAPWVAAVRKEMQAPAEGTFWIANPMAMASALKQTSAQYAEYTYYRDRREFAEWRHGRRHPAGSPANSGTVH
jgi:hypothetical protein